MPADPKVPDAVMSLAAVLIVLGVLINVLLTLGALGLFLVKLIVKVWAW